MIAYVVRAGSNAANQTMTPLMALGTVELPGRRVTWCRKNGVELEEL